MPLSSNDNLSEIIIGLAGPVGVDLDSIFSFIKESLKIYSYDSTQIRLTDEIDKFFIYDVNVKNTDLCSEINYKIDKANSFREKFKDPAAMASLGVNAISELRGKISGAKNSPAFGNSFVIRQIKLPQEVDQFRSVYGSHFVLISAYASEEDRRKRLVETAKGRLPTNANKVDIEQSVRHLISRDENENDNKLGQNMRDAFHMADLIVHGIDKAKMKKDIDRFFAALFGSNKATPSKEEFAMYQAKSAALRSADLSRQVGAAIFNENATIISQGCNEVAKAHGGNYWYGDDPDTRDVFRGYDPNDRLKKDVIKNIIEILFSNRKFSPKIQKNQTAEELFNELTDGKDSLLANSLAMDLTEYGRIVHAEMNAICDAVRNGRSVLGSSLYCTTFPCHNCTKHIIASGVRKLCLWSLIQKVKQLSYFQLKLNSKPSQTKIVSRFFHSLGSHPLDTAIFF
jgi:deoxycytidylate deaminase